MKGNKLFATFLSQLFTFFHKGVLAQGITSSGGFLSALINVDIIIFISLALTDRNRSLIEYTNIKRIIFYIISQATFFLLNVENTRFNTSLMRPQ